MPTLKTSELRKLPTEELRVKYAELYAELSRLKAAAARGAAKKDVGKIRPLRKNVARVLTMLNESKQEEKKDE
ncbi:MAG: 50S ribosomal protein L29 [Thaumarchaeota archaeon]|nr:50S ribosomal protein L29 [Nitrososphaerota archaeon]